MEALGMFKNQGLIVPIATYPPICLEKQLDYFWWGLVFKRQETSRGTFPILVKVLS